MSGGQGGTAIIEGANAIVAALSVRLGRPVRLKVLEDYTDLLAATTAGTVLLAWLPPLIHIDAVDAGARLVAVPERGGSLTYRAALLVRSDSRYHRTTDLAGARMAWTDPVSAAGHIYPKLLLGDAGLPAAQLSERFVGSFRAACASVADGTTDACACFVSEDSHRSPTNMLADIARVFPAAPWRLRVLDVTESIPPDGLVIAPAVEAALARSIADALLALADDPTGRDGIGKLLMATRLVAPTPLVDRALARLRQLRGRV